MIITLVGSTRFKEAHEIAMMHLTLLGHIVIPCGLYGHHDSPSGSRHLTSDGDETTETKQRLDALHLGKIDEADGIFVVNVGLYLGSSTKREIEYARKHKKDIFWMFDQDPTSSLNTLP
jgi:hypothetical protein